MSQTLFGNILELLRTQADQRRDSVAIEDGKGSTVSYGRLLELVSRLSRAFQACSIGRGQRVAVVLPNGSEMAVALLGVTCSTTAVPLNPGYRREEYRSYFDEIGVSFLLTQRGFSNEARQVAAEKGIPILEILDGDEMTLSLDGKAVALSPADDDDDLITRSTGADDIALILLTSGSTGRSKKVPLTHRNVCVSVADICRTLALSPADRCLCMWEQFHVGGLVDLLLVPLASGGSVICAGSFNAQTFYTLLETRRPTWFQGVPTSFHELSAFSKRHFVDPHAAPLRFVRSVASSLSPQLMEEVETLFGVPVIQTFGMTEAGPLITTNLLPPAMRKPGSVGPSCGPEIRIKSPDGAVLATGNIGEIVIRGPNVIAGYEDAPEANLRSFRDGWFHTGDTGYLDEDDYLFLKGRLKEMINRGGEKITPQEIDDVLLSHPAIAQAASFSIKHPTLGEDVGVAIVLKEPNLIDEADVRRFVAERLASFKVPQKVMIIGEMPRDPIGKINRLTLATLANLREEPKVADGAATDTEVLLSKIWAAELGLEQVGLEDNFFALGGDSLSAVRIALAVEEEFGRPLPESALLEGATVRQMARQIDDSSVVSAVLSDGPQASSRTLSASQIRLLKTAMNAGGVPTLGPDIPINVVNPDGRGRPIVWCFNRSPGRMEDYARSIDPDRPMLGLLSGSKLLPFTEDTIDRTARYYADELLKIYPDGRFVLGGNCHGSRIAHRIAKIFAEAGRPIEKMFLMDYFDPSLADYPGKLMLIYSKQSRDRAFLPLLKWGVIKWQDKFVAKPTVHWIAGEQVFQVEAKTVMRLIKNFLDDGYRQPDSEKVRFNLYLALLGQRPLFRLQVHASRALRRLMGRERKKPSPLAMKRIS